MLKRLFDLIFSIIAVVILSPVFLIIVLAIFIDSPGAGIIYKQGRVGKNGKEFNLYKFRTMKPGSDKKGLLTLGGKDSRITRAGHFLRRYKLDELAQLFNVIKGDMSIVGPRPEVKKYVDLYTTGQKDVLSVKPGLTDYASIEYSDENSILESADNPEKLYIETIMPAKLKLNKKYIKDKGFLTDIKVIIATFIKVLFKKSILKL